VNLCRQAARARWLGETGITAGCHRLGFIAIQSIGGGGKDWDIAEAVHGLPIIQLVFDGCYSLAHVAWFHRHLTLATEFERVSDQIQGCLHRALVVALSIWSFAGSIHCGRFAPWSRISFSGLRGSRLSSARICPFSRLAASA
jgi:hypothetical protein